MVVDIYFPEDNGMGQDDLERQATSKAGFIRAYGMHWQADEVDWKGSETGRYREILGRIGINRPGLKVANFWHQRGIYVLHSAHGPYYVGQTIAGGMSLGMRLRQHYLGKNRSPHAGKWDRFSWFGWRGTLSSTDDRGLQRLRNHPRQLLTGSRNTVQDIESLLIHTLGTLNAGNSRREGFVAAAQWEQIWWSERDHYLEKIAP
ncbi:GIY-YIG nuclease family protein [Tenggerimyces flavus]|uniref:GIY-YIG nuclease family protein n=1 Tax=Tenggerimyces flavus TaxID=1708749 RepID=A0ABV7YEN5_9ACTN|nr:GIY-YIG nuclease family protein [Tenggerimyces flavus]MBM7788953.1 hypothetical protein [Tenggerimyces flavus]